MKIFLIQHLFLDASFSFCQFRIGDDNFVKSATGAKKAADKVVMPSDKEVKKPAQSKPSVYDIPVTSEYVTIRLKKNAFGVP